MEQVDSISTASADPKSSPEVQQSASLVRRFLELIRFSHTIFALPFALLACVFALTTSGTALGLTVTDVIFRFAGVLFCMVSARSAAMAFNRLVDARFDAQNPRTAKRHLPSGQLSHRQVWWFFGLCVVGFLLSCLLFLPNWLPLLFAVPVILWICGYSLAKRFTSAAHLWLGVALALSPICAWVALRGQIVMRHPQDLLASVWLGGAIVLWVTGFDIIYACQDADFDRRANLRSIPAMLGVPSALRLSAILHLGMLVVLGTMPSLFPELSLGVLFYVALAVVAALIAWQHWLVSPNDLRRVGLAFFHINAVISFGLCFVAAFDACLR